MDVKPVKPITVVLFLLASLVLLGLISLIFPNNGLVISDNIQVEFPGIRQLTSEKPQYANIDSIVAGAEVVDSLQQSVLDTAEIAVAPKVIKLDTLRADEKKLRAKIRSIEFPSGKENMLEPFFEKLRNGDTRKNVYRILHYGDSQIEGDRITGYLRNRFQRQFGGSGPGLLPWFIPASESATVEISDSGYWKKHSVLLSSDSLYPRENYGILGSCGELNSTDSLKKGKMTYTISSLSYSSVRKFNWARMFYGKSAEPFTLKVFVNDSLLLLDQLKGENHLNFFGLQVNYFPKEVTFEVSGTNLPCFYGVALDQPLGIAVDNIAWRGSRGAEFHKIDVKVLSQFFRQLNVKLIIFQFGVNIVPHIVRNYNFYERQLIRELSYLKQAAGEIPIIVVGVSDMSRKKDGWYSTYPNIEKIRNAQKNAAFKSGCAFWDMYEAMGGRNSMPSWVFAKPSLARKDFTHFNFRGARVVAKMLYNAIMDEYSKLKQDSQVVESNDAAK